MKLMMIMHGEDDDDVNDSGNKPVEGIFDYMSPHLHHCLEQGSCRHLDRTSNFFFTFLYM